MAIADYSKPQFSISFITRETIDLPGEIILLYVLSNEEITVSFDRQKYTLKKDDVIAISGDQTWVAQADNPGLVCQVIIPRRIVSQSVSNPSFAVLCNSVLYPATDYTELKSFFHELVFQYVSSTNKSDISNLGTLYKLVNSLIENYIVQGRERFEYMDADAYDERIQQIIEIIQDNYNTKISLQTIADQMYLSLSHLSKCFKAETGTTFREYVNKVRLQHAFSDLVYTDKSITHIALDNGFANISTLNKVFREEYGVSPQKYREEWQSNKVEKATKEDELKMMVRENIEEYIGAASDDSLVKKKFMTVNASVAMNYQAPWNKILNVGQMSALLDYRVREQLIEMKKTLGAESVRFWNILTDTMGLGSYQSDDYKDYNFSAVDNCLDFLLSNNIRPHFLFGYKGMSRSTEKREYFSFKTLEELCGALRMLLGHLVHRYGIGIVNSWEYEIWHPAGYSKHEDIFYNGDEEIYSVAVYENLRRFLPLAKIGGAEFSMMQGFRETIRKQLNEYRDKGVALDFISVVSFPYDFKDSAGGSATWIADENYTKKDMRIIKELLSEMGLGKLPVYLIEYNLSFYDRNILFDTCFCGTYTLKTQIDSIDMADKVAYWAFSDTQTEGPDTNRLLHGGNGLVSRNGVRKPVYYALYFLNRCLPKMICRDDGCMICTDDHGNYSALIYNLQYPNAITFLREKGLQFGEEEGLFSNAGTNICDITLKDIAPGNYRTAVMRMDSSHDILSWWRNSGYCFSIKDYELEYIKSNCAPSLRIKTLSVDSSRTLTIHERLLPNSFALCYFERVL